MGFRAMVFSSLLCAALVGCGDLTDAVGDQGRVELTLATDYEVDGALDEVTLVAGHKQSLSVDLTSKGEDEIVEPEDLTYRLDPSAGASIDAVGGGGSEPPDIEVLVTKPGTYRLLVVSKGKEVDSFTLKFDTSASLELVVKVRAPWQDKFEDVSEAKTSVVAEGSQAVFLPIPLDKAGDRLAGRIETRAVADPSVKVVSGSDINGVYEQGVWTGSGKIEFYFIDPGEITVTVTDLVSKATGKHAFSVTNVGD